METKKEEKLNKFIKFLSENADPEQISHLHISKRGNDTCYVKMINKKLGVVELEIKID